MTTAALNSPKDHALYYHDLGFSVFVLRNSATATEVQLRDRKRPAVLWDLYQIMRPNKIQIERWFSKNPDYNIAIVTGSISKIIAFDVDGHTAVKRVEEKRVEMSKNLQVALDHTMVNRTGSGGTHIIFRVEEDISDISQKKLWSDGKEHSQILMQGNEHYIVAAPSIHPNGKKYEWNGQEPELITRQELNELIRLLSAPGMVIEESIKPSRTLSANFAVSLHEQEERHFSTEDIQRLVKWIKPLYIPGDRDHIVMFLSGTMRKDAGYSHEDTSNFFKLLTEASGHSDEDLDKTLKTVDRTYRLPIEEINGKSGLYDTIVKSYEGSVLASEYQGRVEAYSRICQIINGEPKTPGEPDDDKGGGSADDNDNNNNKPTAKVVNSVEQLLREKVFEDPDSRVIKYLADQVMSRITFKTLFDTHDILYYDKHKNHNYRSGGDAIIDIEIEKIIKEINAPYSIRKQTKAEVRKVIADNTIVYREQFDADTYTINLENCMLDIIELKEIPHSPDYLTMAAKFPVVYDPQADCPKIKKFLGDVIQDPYKLKEVLKFAAYILIKDCRYEKGLMCLGGGANGKSVYIKTNEAFVGADNCCHLSLHDIEEDRFARARLFGKVLNTYADNKSQRLKETGNLKTAISGDTIEGQEKFKPRFSFRNKAKIQISTNNPPETEDKSHAFYRRWIIVTFDRTFANSDDPNDPNRKDTGLIFKLTIPQELSGYLNLALRYLPILFGEGGFAEEPIDKVKKEYEFKADHVSKYLQEYCIIDSTKKDYMTKTSELYQHYVRVCRENMQVRELDENVFGSKLVEHGIMKRRRRIKGQRTLEYVYEPLMIKHNLLKEQDSIFQLQQEQQPTTVTNSTTGAIAHEQSTITTIRAECPYCALENEAGNSPLFYADTVREVQVHIVLEHPGLDFEGIIEES